MLYVSFAKGSSNFDLNDAKFLRKTEENTRRVINYKSSNILSKNCKKMARLLAILASC